MAKPLDYQPVAFPEETAREELEQLIQTLHESGVLRLLDGFFGRIQDVGEVAVGQIDTPGGRNALGNVAILVRLLTELDSDHLNAFMEGTTEGLAAARESLKGDPPSLVSLFGTLREPEVRRGLNAVLVLLGTLGRHVHTELEKP